MEAERRQVPSRWKGRLSFGADLSGSVGSNEDVAISMDEESEEDASSWKKQNQQSMEILNFKFLKISILTFFKHF